MYEITPDGFWACLLALSIPLSLYQAINGKYKSLMYFLAGFGCIAVAGLGMNHNSLVLAVLFLPGLVLILFGALLAWD